MNKLARNYMKRFGQFHPKATLTDREVELVRQLREQGMTIRAIAVKMEIGKATVWDIVHYRTRTLPVTG